MWFRKKKSKAEALRDVFNDPGSRWFTPVNDFFVIITLISVIAIVLETVPSLEQFTVWFRLIEYTTAALFSLEYVGRLIAAPKKLKYIFSFFGIIDLLAILPTFLGLANFTFLKTARTLRIMRFLRMLRLAKVTRPKKSHGHDLEDKASLYKLNIEIYFATLTITLLLFGTLIYFFEGTHPSFVSIPHGMYWTLQIILNDGAAAVPHTTIGAALTILIRFVSLILLGLLISVIGNLVRKLLFGTDDIE